VRLAALIAAKDLRETVRDKLSFIFILIMPLAFTLFFGLLFGGGSDVDKLPLAVWDADGGAAAKALVGELDKSEVVLVVVKQGDELEQWMADERAAAGLIIPDGYSDAVASGEQADLTIVATQGTSGASTVASEIRTLAGEQVTVELASKAAAEAIWATRSMPAGVGDGVVAESAKEARPVVAQALADPAVSTRVVEAGAAAGQTPSGFILSSPGMMVNFVLFSLMTAGIALIIERQNGTLQRLMTTRLRKWQLIGGKAAGMFLLTFAQQAILIAVAQIFFGVDYLRDPAALLLMMVSLSLVASTLGLLLAAVLKSEQALIATTVLVSMALAAMSGAWFPLEITGETFQSVGHVLPTAWILDGLRGIVVRGFDVADVLPAFWVSLAWAAGFFVVAVWRFRLSD
jgi:ABC-2 type transport system permease protein